jgi:hypothetical protein
MIGRVHAQALLLALEVARAVVSFADQQLGSLDQPESS